MDPIIAEVLGVFFRWLHIASVVTLIGGVFYARRAAAPVAPAFRPVAYSAMGGILISGFYNYLTKPFYPPMYHMLIGIKLLLVLHVIAVTALLWKPGVEDAKRKRWMTGIISSGAVILLISAYLRWISMHGVPPAS